MTNLCPQTADSAGDIDSCPSLGRRGRRIPTRCFPLAAACRAIILPRKLFSHRQLAELGVLQTPPEIPSRLRLSSSKDQNLEELLGGDPGSARKVRSCEEGSDDEPQRKKVRVLEEKIGGEMVSVGGTEGSVEEGLNVAKWLESEGNVESVDLGDSLGGEAEMLQRRVFEEEEIPNIDQILEMTRTCGQKDVLDENYESMGLRESVVDGGPTERESALEESEKDILDGSIEMPESSIGKNEGKRPLEDRVKDIVQENIGLKEMRESIAHEGANKYKMTLEDGEKDVVDQNIGLIGICESTVGGNEGKKRDREKDILEDVTELMKIYKSWLAGTEGKMHLKDGEKDVVDQNIGLIGICESTVSGNEGKKRDRDRDILEDVTELMKIYKSWLGGTEGKMHLKDGEKDIPEKKMKGKNCESSMNVGTNKAKTPLEYSEKHKWQESMKEAARKNESVAPKTGTLVEYMDALKVVYANHSYKYDDDDDDDDDGFLETAKKLGITFSRTRWTSP